MMRLAEGMYGRDRQGPFHEPAIGRVVALRRPRPRHSGRQASAAERGADGAARRPYPSVESVHDCDAHPELEVEASHERVHLGGLNTLHKLPACTLREATSLRRQKSVYTNEPSVYNGCPQAHQHPGDVWQVVHE
jgi:hypothetical protein